MVCRYRLAHLHSSSVQVCLYSSSVWVCLYSSVRVCLYSSSVQVYSSSSVWVSMYSSVRVCMPLCKSGCIPPLCKSVCLLLYASQCAFLFCASLLVFLLLCVSLCVFLLCASLYSSSVWISVCIPPLCKSVCIPPSLFVFLLLCVYSFSMCSLFCCLLPILTLTCIHRLSVWEWGGGVSPVLFWLINKIVHSTLTVTGVTLTNLSTLARHAVRIVLPAQETCRVKHQGKDPADVKGRAYLRPAGLFCFSPSLSSPQPLPSHDERQNIRV